MKLLFNYRLLIFIIALILIILLVIPFSWPKAKIQGYTILRNLSKFHLSLITNEFKSLSDQNFIIKYSSENEESARLVLENSQEIMGKVNSILDYANQETVPVIVYPSMAELNKSFGWDGDRSPMGVYW